MSQKEIKHLERKLTRLREELTQIREQQIQLKVRANRVEYQCRVLEKKLQNLLVPSTDDFDTSGRGGDRYGAL